MARRCRREALVAEFTTDVLDHRRNIPLRVGVDPRRDGVVDLG